MASRSYMPARQAEQVTWAQTFATVVGQDREAYGIPVDLMQQFIQTNNSLQGLWVAAVEPSTRTRGVVAAKNAALAEMKRQARNLVSIIQGTPTVTPQMKINAGVTIRDTHPTPVPPPQDAPVLQVKKVSGRTVTLTIRPDQARRGKPAGVAGATVFVYTGPNPPEDNNDWKFIASVSRTTFNIPFGPSSTGDTAWITAFWTNAKNQSGPACEPIRVNLPAGGVLPHEAEDLTVRQAA